MRSLTDRRFARVVLRAKASVPAGHGIRLETIATGAGLLGRGTRTYLYVINRPRRPAFIVQTTRARGSDWLARKRILDRAIRSLGFQTPR